MWHFQLTRNVARSNVAQRQFDNALPDGERKRSAVDENAAQLVNSRLAYDHFEKQKRELFKLADLARKIVIGTFKASRAWTKSGHFMWNLSNFNEFWQTLTNFDKLCRTSLGYFLRTEKVFLEKLDSENRCGDRRRERTVLTILTAYFRLLSSCFSSFLLSFSLSVNILNQLATEPWTAFTLNFQLNFEYAKLFNV